MVVVVRLRSTLGVSRVNGRGGVHTTRSQSAGPLSETPGLRVIVPAPGLRELWGMQHVALHFGKGGRRAQPAVESGQDLRHHTQVPFSKTPPRGACESRGRDRHAHALSHRLARALRSRTPSRDSSGGASERPHALHSSSRQCTEKPSEDCTVATATQYVGVGDVASEGATAADGTILSRRRAGCTRNGKQQHRTESLGTHQNRDSYSEPHDAGPARDRHQAGLSSNPLRVERIT